MVGLLPLPDREGRAGDARLWFNPERITSAVPVVSRSPDADGDVITLSVELKLDGLPAQRAWLATCRPDDVPRISLAASSTTASMVPGAVALLLTALASVSWSFGQ